MPIFYKSPDSKQHKTQLYHKANDDRWHYVKNVYTKQSDNKWHPVYTYDWVPSAWSACSAPCGGGTQTRTITCIRNDNISRPDVFCDGISRPSTVQSCNTQGCWGIEPINYVDLRGQIDWVNQSGTISAAIARIGSETSWEVPPANGADTPCKAAAYCGLLVGWNWGSIGFCSGSNVTMQQVVEERSYHVYHKFISFMDTIGHTGNPSSYQMRLINEYNGKQYAQWSAFNTRGYNMAYVDMWQLPGQGNHTRGHMSGWLTYYYGLHTLPIGTDRIPYVMEGHGQSPWNGGYVMGITASHFYLIPA